MQTRINADFSQRVVVHGGETPWIDSPMPGVARRPLDRIGDEVARATSIVRYAPGSHFSPHTHDGGEEFLVLDGVFQDEHGDFPAGSYIRNPPTSSHTPGAEAGCVIFVKLWQFDPADRTHVRVDAATAPSGADPGRPGVTVTPLHRDNVEDVRMETWASDAAIELPAPDGAELLVIDGTAAAGPDALRPWSWLRLPPGTALTATAGPDGARVWLKTGHLAQISAPTA